MSVPCGKKYENNYQQQPKTFIKLQLSRWTASKSGVFPQDVKAASPHRHGQGSLQESSSSSFFFFSSSSLSAVCPAGPQGANQMAAWVSTVSRECGELLASLPPLFKFCEELHGSDRGAHRRSGWARGGGGGQAGRGVRLVFNPLSSAGRDDECRAASALAAIIYHLCTFSVGPA